MATVADERPDDTPKRRGHVANLVERIAGVSKVGAHTTNASTISTDLTIDGNVKCNGEAKLDGAVLGNVECQNLIVGENGRIQGDINAESVVVYGSVQGAVHARRVILMASSTVEGDIYHDGLGIEMGARFVGASHRFDQTPSASLALQAAPVPRSQARR